MARIKTYIEKITPFIDKYRHHRGEGGDTPTPVSLVKFYKGQIIKGLDFGNVRNGQVNTELDQFLLTSTGSGESYLIQCDNDFAVCAVHMGELGIMFIPGNSVTILYATQDFDVEGISGTKGWQNIPDTGKIYIKDLGWSVDSFEVYDLDSAILDPSWNGKFMGAIEAEPGPTPPGPTPPTPSLSPFEKNDILENNSKIKFDTSDTASDFWGTLLPTFEYPQENPFVPLLVFEQSDGGQALNLGAMSVNGHYILLLTGVNGGDMLMNQVWNDTEKFNISPESRPALDENGEFTVLIPDGENYHYFADTFDGSEASWNGIYLGK